MASVEERELAGIGQRFMVATNQGDHLIIVVRDSGGVELYRQPPGSEQNDCIATLDSDEARLVAAIIGRTIYRSETIERLRRLGMVVAWHTLGQGSYAVGKSLQELNSSRFATVSILAVVEKGGERRANPDPAYTLKAESQIALAGNSKDVQDYLNFLEKGPH
jgi:K+/H+ antiporter YhaU regulatory subunit KhtT